MFVVVVVSIFVFYYFITIIITTITSWTREKRPFRYSVCYSDNTDAFDQGALWVMITPLFTWFQNDVNTFSTTDFKKIGIFCHFHNRHHNGCKNYNRHFIFFSLCGFRLSIECVAALNLERVGEHKRCIDAFFSEENL